MTERTVQPSNNMKQRISIACSFTPSPKKLQLEKPIGKLHSSTCRNLQRVLVANGSRTQMTVTHDADEAGPLADRVAMKTSRPGARTGKVVDAPLPRTREVLPQHPHFGGDKLREEPIGFFNDCGSQR